MANKIQITGDFDGGNPKDPNSIIQTDSNSFTITPYSEDDDPNYKFRLDIKVFNHSSDTANDYMHGGLSQNEDTSFQNRPDLFFRSYFFYSWM